MQNVGYLIHQLFWSDFTLSIAVIIVALIRSNNSLIRNNVVPLHASSKHHSVNIENLTSNRWNSLRAHAFLTRFLGSMLWIKPL